MSESKELQVLAEIPRGKTDLLRCTRDSFTSDDGKTSQYISLRVYYLSDGKWLPTKKGVTIRQRELLAIGKALRVGLDALTAGDDDNRFAPGNRQPTTPHASYGSANDDEPFGF